MRMLKLDELYYVIRLSNSRAILGSKIAKEKGGGPCSVIDSIHLTTKMYKKNSAYLLILIYIYSY